MSVPSWKVAEEMLRKPDGVGVRDDDDLLQNSTKSLRLCKYFYLRLKYFKNMYVCMHFHELYV
jgi:hypothetical protein